MFLGKTTKKVKNDDRVIEMIELTDEGKPMPKGPSKARDERILRYAREHAERHAKIFLSIDEITALIKTMKIDFSLSWIVFVPTLEISFLNLFAKFQLTSSLSQEKVSPHTPLSLLLLSAKRTAKFADSWHPLSEGPDFSEQGCKTGIAEIDALVEEQRDKDYDANGL